MKACLGFNLKMSVQFIKLFTMFFIRNICNPINFGKAHQILHQLRPSLTFEEFARRYPEMQKKGYQLHGGYVEEQELVVIAGSQIFHSFSSGNFLWIYDLVTSEQHRSKGYGIKILKYLEELSLLYGCSQIRLDSRLARKEAHSFYEEKAGYKKYGYVFVKKLDN
jgi:GNAT superfamily N-acetyltransferase